MVSNLETKHSNETSYPQARNHSKGTGGDIKAKKLMARRHVDGRMLCFPMLEGLRAAENPRISLSLYNAEMTWNLNP